MLQDTQINEVCVHVFKIILIIIIIIIILK